MPGSKRRSLAIFLILVVVLGAGGGVALWRAADSSPTARGGLGSGDPAVDGAVDGVCADGFQPVEDALSEVRGEMRNEEAGADESEDADSDEGEAADSDEGEAADSDEGEEAGSDEGPDADADSDSDSEAGDESEESEELVREAQAELPMLRGTDPDDWDHLCVPGKRPESLKDLANLFGSRAMSRLAPFGAYEDGAALAAVRASDRLGNSTLAAAKGKARLYGHGPLIVNDPRYPEVNGIGLVHNMGRVDSYAFDPVAKRLFVAVGNGGIYRSSNMARSWRSSNGDLPTTVTGAVAWSPYKHTLLALTGEPTFGASAYTGLGAYYSSDLGKHWTRSRGVPSGALGFALAVDPARPSRVYAATQLGLFVSTDGGRNYRNTRLPVGRRCVGVTDVVRKPTCALRAVVTDVVVVKPGGVHTTTKAGTVVATVGWRGGMRRDINGNVQATRNGVYRSATGSPGTFVKLATTNFTKQSSIGRIELGNAVGPQQDHDLLYAIVQNSNLLNFGGAQGIEVPEGTNPPVGTTVLDGIFVSRDFGKSWTKLVSGNRLATDATTGSALTGVGTATGYEPGVQGWYNMWVQPDPSRATASGAPTRMAFGLEEVWSNDADTAKLPLDGTVPVHFGVVGKYYGGESCLLLNVGLPACPTSRTPTQQTTTTHPDQQDGIWVPDPKVKGGVQLVVGNDGGVYRYQFDKDDDTELDNAHWGSGDQTGLATLMPYYAAMADDGTVYAGLQDNGNLKIDGRTRKQYETYGGDGFYAAVDPANSRTAYEEYTNGAISVTTDGGTTWTSIDPGLTNAKFSTPFVMDQTDAKHLLTGGREIVETTIGSATTAGMTVAGSADSGTTTWRTVYNLGTRAHPGSASVTATATDPDNSMSAVATLKGASYVGFCGQCDTLNKLAPNRSVFQNGLATNVGGSKPGRAGTAAGWHMVKPKGLPNRYITSIAIDPGNSRHLVLTLGGYTRRWVPPGAVQDANKQLGRGHLFASVDGGRHFRDISGNLPDTPANFVTLRGRQLLVATDVGAFASGLRGFKASAQPRFARMNGLPRSPVSSISIKPDNRNLAVLAMFGRDVWTYAFKQKIKANLHPPTPPTTIGKVLSTSSFEPSAQGWAAAGTPTWTRSSPGHGAGTSGSSTGTAYAITGSGYTDNMDATVTSPAVKVPKGTAVVSWWMLLDTESPDPVKVEYSTNGAAYQTLASYSGKNPGNPKWAKYTLSLPSRGGTLRVRFHFTSDELCSGTLALPGVCSQTQPYDGVHVDDVEIGTAKG